MVRWLLVEAKIHNGDQFTPQSRFQIATSATVRRHLWNRLVVGRFELILADLSWSEQISRIRTSPKRKCDASALSVGRFYEPNRWSVTIFLFVFVDSRDLWFLRHTCDAIMLPLLHGKKSPKSSVCLHRNNSFWSAHWYSNQEHGSKRFKTSFR